MSAFTVYSEPGFNPDKPTIPLEKREQGFYLLDTFRKNPPGGWIDNKWEEVNHDKGAVYVAIRAIMDVIHCASVTVGRKARNRGKATLAGGKLVKSHQSSATDQEYQPVIDHPICRLVEKPNAVDTLGDILSYMILQNRLTGVAPLWTVPNDAGKVVELYALPTALTTPQWARTPEFPRGAWRIQPFYASGGLGYLPTPFSGAGAIIPNEEIQRFMDPHPMFRWDGKSPLAAGSFQLDILEEIDQARWAAFDHGVTMDAVLQVDGFDDRQIERLESRMEQKHQGARNHRRFLVVSGQGTGQDRMRIQTFSQSPKEMDFSNSWDQMIGFVLALFGVPKSVSGLATVTSYSELYAALRQFYQRQKALAFRLAEFLSKALCWRYSKFPGEYRIQIDLPALDDPDLLEKQLSLDTQNAGITVNELRKLRNREPVDNGDLPPTVYLAALQQQVAPPPQPAAQPGMEGEQGAPGEMGGEDEQVPGSPEEMQDSIAQDAMAALGIPAEGEMGNEQMADDEQPDQFKAVGQPQKSGIYTDSRGHRYRLENGRRVPLGDQQQPGQRRAPGGGSGKPGRMGGGGSNRLSQRQQTGQRGGQEKQYGDVPPKPSGGLVGYVTQIAKEIGRRMLGTGKQPPQPKRIVAQLVESAQKHARNAARVPGGKEVIARAKLWADDMAMKHGAKVAAHFGLDEGSGRTMLRNIIMRLCRESVRFATEGGEHVIRRGDQELKLGFKRRDVSGGKSGKGPTAGAAPKPENKMAEGTGIPRPGIGPERVKKQIESNAKYLKQHKKAMSAYIQSMGGSLVRPAGLGLRARKRKRKVRRVVKSLLEGL